MTPLSRTSHSMVALVVFVLLLLSSFIGLAAAGTACTGLCGFFNPTGTWVGGARVGYGCYCDTYCHTHKDCCADEVAVCEGIVVRLVEFVWFLL